MCSVKCTSVCICGKCKVCGSRCLFRSCLPAWQGWICPHNESMLRPASTYRCHGLRCGCECHDTWTTRRALLGAFGQDFLTIDRHYHGNGRWSHRLSHSCAYSTCEECWQHERLCWSNIERARICGSCYVVMILQLGASLSSSAGHCVSKIMQYVHEDVDRYLRILQYIHGPRPERSH